MAFQVRGQVSPEAEQTARTKYASEVDDQISRLTQTIFDNEVEEVLRDFRWQADSILNRGELEALDAVKAGKARANQMRMALAALNKVKAAQ
jgi:hypothetical protein